MSDIDEGGWEARRRSKSLVKSATAAEPASRGASLNFEASMQQVDQMKSSARTPIY